MHKHATGDALSPVQKRKILITVPSMDLHWWCQAWAHHSFHCLSCPCLCHGMVAWLRACPKGDHMHPRLKSPIIPSWLQFAEWGPRMAFVGASWFHIRMLTAEDAVKSPVTIIWRLVKLKYIPCTIIFSLLRQPLSSCVLSFCTCFKYNC